MEFKGTKIIISYIILLMKTTGKEGIEFSGLLQIWNLHEKPSKSEDKDDNYYILIITNLYKRGLVPFFALKLGGFRGK